MLNMTVVHYTSNRKLPSFAFKIRENILRLKGDLPLISVSQKPMDFGINICVGDVGLSIHNAWRQLQIGAIEATTKFICVTEDDILYPIEYFKFSPPEENVFYLAEPAYTCYAQRNRIKFFAYNRRGHEGAMIAGREFLIEKIGKTLDKYGMWSPPVARMHLFRGSLEEKFYIPVPTMSFRTDQDMHRRAKYDRRNKLIDFPPFGNCYEFLKKFGLR
jgi:hypothetical protein